MNQFDVGMLHLEEAKYHLNKAIKIIFELSGDDKYVGLRRASNTNVQNQQTIASIIAESENRYGERTGANVGDRNEAVTQLRDRVETGYGQPQDLGDIT